MAISEVALVAGAGTQLMQPRRPPCDDGPGHQPRKGSACAQAPAVTCHCDLESGRATEAQMTSAGTWSV